MKYFELHSNFFNDRYIFLNKKINVSNRKVDNITFKQMTLKTLDKELKHTIGIMLDVFLKSHVAAQLFN